MEGEGRGGGGGKGVMKYLFNAVLQATQNGLVVSNENIYFG